MRKLMIVALIIELILVTACGRVVTGPEDIQLPAGVCADTDTLWQNGDSVLIKTVYKSGDNCK